MVAFGAMRYPAMRRARRQKTTRDNRTPLDISLLGLCVVGLLVMPVLWRVGIFHHMADHRQSVWSIAAGIVTGITFLWLFRRSHKDLGRNWSVTLEIREGHRLVTNGVYAYLRHPMYASFFLWGITQALLIPNWIAGLSGLAAILCLYAERQGREEAMMRATFGAEYDAYCARTRRIVPGIF
ncbi:protein-S-isoprenylcysteine O-methyltransferase [Rhizobium sp. PAMB 3174]